MSLKHIVHKAARSVKKHAHRYSSRRAWFGKKNPVVHAVRSVVRGFRHKRWSKNIAKYVDGSSRSDVSMPYSYTVDGASGNEYVHNSRTLSQLTGGV